MIAAQAGAGAGLAAVLLDHDQHSIVPGDWSEDLQTLHPHRSVGGPGTAEGQDVPDSSSRRLENALLDDVQAVGRIGIDSREHHQRLQTQVAAALAQLFGFLGRSIGGQDRDRFAALVLVVGAPGDKAIARFLDAAQGPLQGKGRVRQGHAGDLKPCRLAAIDRPVLHGRLVLSSGRGDQGQTGKASAHLKETSAIQRGCSGGVRGGHGVLLW